MKLLKILLRKERGISPPEYLALYAKVFLVISTIYSTAFLIQGWFLKNWDKFIPPYRILFAHFMTKKFRVSVIVSYALVEPTAEDTSDSDKFYL